MAPSGPGASASVLKAYPAMKGSGVPWLGEVPAHWEIEPIARIGQLFKGRGGSKEDEEPVGVPCVRYGDLYTRHQFFISSTKAFVSLSRAAAYTPTRRGDVLFAASGETIEDIGRSAVNLLDVDAVCGGDVILLRPNRPINPRFLGYAADAPSSRHQKATMGRGFTVVHVYGSELKRLTLAIPPVGEQDAIVRFLDHADRRIRHYIRAKQELIKLLEEQKRAVIHRAVTRGLDPDVRLKASGVERLGDVPEHWEMRRLKSIVARIDQGVSPQAENYLAEGEAWGVLKAGCVNRGVFREREHKRLPAGFDFNPSLAVATGDVLVSRASGSPHLVGSAGRVSSLTFKVILSDKIFRPVFVRAVDPEFMVLVMNGRYYRQQVLQAISGAEGLANNLPLSSLRAFYFAIPPRDEQHAIVSRLRKTVDEIVTTVGRIERDVILFREYRNRLIADVVTGKLDVRLASERLAREVEEPEAIDDAEGEGGAEESDQALEGIPEEAEA